MSLAIEERANVRPEARVVERPELRVLGEAVVE